MNKPEHPQLCPNRRYRFELRKEPTYCSTYGKSWTEWKYKMCVSVRYGSKYYSSRCKRENGDVLDPNKPLERFLIARFQTCAWMDRAARYAHLGNRMRADRYRDDRPPRKPMDRVSMDWKADDAFKLAKQCQRIANHWRIWERLLEMENHHGSH